MTSIYHFFRGSLDQIHDDWPKRRVLVNTLVLSALFLIITSISFYTIGFETGSLMGAIGMIGVIHVGLFFRKKKRLISSVNLLALYSNIIFLVEVIFSGGISSPALYWLTCAPFYALIFSDYEVNRNSAFWIFVTFSEFIILFTLDNRINEIPIEYDEVWHETLVLVFVITFMCYCSVIILFDVQSRKYRSLLGKGQNLDPLVETAQIDAPHQDDIISFRKESGRLHQQMIWIGIILLPLFPDVMFFNEDDWMVFFAIRIGIVLYFVLVQYAYLVGKISPRFLAHLCLGVMAVFLSYVTSQVPIENVFVYNANYSAVFLISSMFLLWKWHDTLIVVLIAFISYLGFFYFNDRLTTTFFVEKGGALLFSIAFASIWLADFRYRFFLKEEKFKRELKESNELLSDHNDKLKTLNKRLKISEQKEKDSSNIKDKFFSIISHDLRSPISTVTSFIRVLNDKTIDLGKKKEEEILERLENSLQNVEMLMDNLLNWARSQMGTLSLRFEFFDVREIANQCISLFEEDLKRKKIRINVDQRISTKAFGDRRTIEFVIRNLLANAIKFSYENSIIRIKFDRKDELLNVKVIDNGVGMSQAEIRDLMNPNIHFTKTGTSKEIGTGLGVQLCIDFVNKNKGQFLIESVEGHGSTFIFCLPTSRLSKPEVNVENDLYDIMDN